MKRGRVCSCALGSSGSDDGPKHAATNGNPSIHVARLSSRDPCVFTAQGEKHNLRRDLIYRSRHIAPLLLPKVSVLCPGNFKQSQGSRLFASRDAVNADAARLDNP